MRVTRRCACGHTSTEHTVRILIGQYGGKCDIPGCPCVDFDGPSDPEAHAE